MPRRGRGRGRGKASGTEGGRKATKRKAEEMEDEPKPGTSIDGSEAPLECAHIEERLPAATGNSVPAATTRRSRRGQPLGEVEVPRELKPPPEKKKSKQSEAAQARKAKKEAEARDAEARKLPKDEAMKRIASAITEEDTEALISVLDTNSVAGNDVRDLFIKCVKEDLHALVEAFTKGPFKFNLNLQRMDDGNFPLIWAVEQNKIDLLKALTSHPIPPKQAKDIKKGNKAPQLLAAYSDNFEILRILLEAGLDPNSGYHHGNYPLHVAIDKGNKEMVELLLNHGAKASQQAGNDYNKYSPLMQAVEKCGRDDPKRDVCYQKQREIVQLILSKVTSRSINQQSILNETALFIAIPGGNTQVIRWLLDKGANPEIRRSIPNPDYTDYYSSSPLLMAIEHGEYDTFKMLLETEEIDLSRPDDSYTYLSYAVMQHKWEREGSDDFVQPLLDAGAKPDWGNREGWTSMHTAAAEGLWDTFQLLLKHDGSLDGQSNQGKTPFLAAIEASMLTTAGKLIAANCDVNAKKVIKEWDRVRQEISVKSEEDALYYLVTKGRLMTEMGGLSQASTYEHHDGFIRMLIEAGYDARERLIDWISNDSWPRRRSHQMQDESVMFSVNTVTWLKHYAENPLSLKNLSRISVRKLIGQPFISKLSENTVIPGPIKNFLQFSEYRLDTVETQQL